MKKRTTEKILFWTITSQLLLIIFLLIIYYKNNYSVKKEVSLIKTSSINKSDYTFLNSAIPFTTLKWLENLKFAKKGLLTRADLQVVHEGIITQLSFQNGEYNVNQEIELIYPYVVRIELKIHDSGKKYTLFFSKARYEISKLYRIGKDDLITKANWSDLKIGDNVKIEENINLLISNTDNNNRFTDEFVNSLTIYIK